MNLDGLINKKQKKQKTPGIVQDVLNEFSLKPSGEDEVTDEMFEMGNDPKSPFQGEVSYKIGCAQLDVHGTSWFETSANAGYPDGMYALARLCEVGMGNGIPQDKFKLEPDFLAAAYWYQQAAKHGHEKSIGKSEQLFKQVLGLADSGNVHSMFDIGACYETGVFDCAAKDSQLALKWYQRAADSGSVPAHRALFEIYFTGAYSIAQNWRQAFDHLKKWSKGLTERKLDIRSKSCTSIGSLRSVMNLAADAPIPIILLALYESEDKEHIDEFVEWAKKAELEAEFGWTGQLLRTLFIYRTDNNLENAQESLIDIIFEIELCDIGSEYFTDAVIDLNLGLTGINLPYWGWPFGDFTERKFRDKNSARCRGVEGILREIAQQEVTVAKLLLGLVLISNADAGSPDFAEGEAWLVETVRSNDLLGCLSYANLARSGQIKGNSEKIKDALKRVIHEPHEIAKEQFEKTPRKYVSGKEMFSEEYFHVLKQRASEQLHEIELEEAALLAKERAEKDMLSYLTHTLNNTLSSGPESARQAMRILGSELYENNREYKAINNIASMFSTFLFAQQLLKTFKLYIAEPEALRQNWDADIEGDASISVVLAMSLRQTLSQVIFDSNHQAALKRLLPHRDAGAVKAIRKDFMDVIVPLDVDATNSRLISDWVQNHLGLIQLHIDPSAELHFRSNSTRYTFFFSIFSELIYNALKYSDGTQPIDITWEKDCQAIGGGTLFRCINTWTDESIRFSGGSSKGLVFLARLAEMLGATFEKCIENNRFVAEIRLPENLLKGKA